MTVGLIPGGTKLGEISRTAEMLPDIANAGAYFLVAFLYDSGYQHSDLKLILDEMERRKIGFKPHIILDD